MLLNIISCNFEFAEKFLTMKYELYSTCIELVIKMCDVAAGEAQDLDLAELPVGRLRRYEQAQRVERRVHAAWKY